jgi:hypothetical protein
MFTRKLDPESQSMNNNATDSGCAAPRFCLNHLIGKTYREHVDGIQLDPDQKRPISNNYFAFRFDHI